MPTSLSPTFSQVTSAQRRTIIAAALGWMLDAFDAMLYALVVVHIMRDLGMSKSTAGLLNSLTLLASGIGGVAFGFIADRLGRKRALMLSILTYSVCSFASGLATSVVMLAVFRFILGLGMGGEWNTGAALVAESWPTEFRAKAISIVQSSWALGFAAAALVAGPVSRFYGWRAVFFVGILPALITLWIQRSVPESEMWRERNAPGSGDAKSPLLAKPARSGAPDGVEPRNELGARNEPGCPTSPRFWEKRGFSTRTGNASGNPSIATIFSPPYVKHTFALLLFNFFAMFAWWGLFTWLPPYLSLPVEQGGRGFGVMGMTTLMVVLNLFGMFPGYASFGWVADHLGRRKSFLMYTFGAAVLVPFYAQARSPVMLLVLGTLVAF